MCGVGLCSGLCILTRARHCYHKTFELTRFTNQQVVCFPNHMPAKSVLLSMGIDLDVLNQLGHMVGLYLSCDIHVNIVLICTIAKVVVVRKGGSVGGDIMRLIQQYESDDHHSQTLAGQREWSAEPNTGRPKRVVS